jgi:hypothetical protein
LTRRHCERSEAIHAAPGLPQSRHGLLSRYAPRNDGGVRPKHDPAKSFHTYGLGSSPRIIVEMAHFMKNLFVPLLQVGDLTALSRFFGGCGVTRKAREGSPLGHMQLDSGALLSSRPRTDCQPSDCPSGRAHSREQGKRAATRSHAQTLTPASTAACGVSIRRRTLIRRFAPPSPASGKKGCFAWLCVSNGAHQGRGAPPRPLAGEGWGEGNPPAFAIILITLRPRVGAPFTAAR